ncbi:MAG TPA: MaoC family dehydratase [Pyrinomonadaceae bacterium]|nr:MaoC family dehydratase [Pyrinomonadaceae bacterium]
MEQESGTAGQYHHPLADPVVCSKSVMQVGDKISWERSFTEDDIRSFARLSGDAGEHHLVPDAQGRFMAHGLLTATLPTKIGGDINFIASEMIFNFHRPVFAGDTIRCDVTVTHFEPGEQYARLTSDWVCVNQDGKEVMTGSGRGIIRNG